MDLTNAIIALFVGCIASAIGFFLTRDPRESGVLQKREGPESGLKKVVPSVVNFLYFSGGVATSVFTPELRQLLGL